MINTRITLIEQPAVASSGKTENIQLRQAQIIFDKLPKLAELRNIDRRSDNGKFITTALLICAYKTWAPDNPDICELMMQELMCSPTIRNAYTPFTREFVRNAMRQNDKWRYLADAYFDGASPQNHYTPSLPLTITVREYPYLPQSSTIYGCQLLIDKVVLEFNGSQNQRTLSLYCDPQDDRWYIWSDSHGSLLADIIAPL